MHGRFCRTGNAFLLACAFLAQGLFAGEALAAREGSVTIKYLGNTIYTAGREDVFTFIYGIGNDLNLANVDLSAQLKAELQAEVPSSVRVDGARVIIDHYFEMDFASIGGGQLQVAVDAPRASAHADFSYISSSLLTADVDINLSSAELTGTYDIYTGNVAISVTRAPSVSLNVDLGGLAGELGNFVTFGGLNAVVNWYVDRFETQTEATILALLQDKIAQYSTPLWGLDQIVPANLVWNGIDVAAEIRNALNGLPTGTILHVYYQAATDLDIAFNVNIGHNVQVLMGYACRRCGLE